MVDVPIGTSAGDSSTVTVVLDLSAGPLWCLTATASSTVAVEGQSDETAFDFTLGLYLNTDEDLLASQTATMYETYKTPLSVTSALHLTRGRYTILAKTEAEEASLGATVSQTLVVRAVQVYPPTPY